MKKSIAISPRKIRALLLFTAAATSMIWNGCSGPRVVVMSSDQTETFMKSNQVLRAPMDGVFMPLAKYQRYRRAVADRIEELQK
jgi:hypothetical protein